MKTKLLSQKRLSQFLFTLGLFLMCVNMGWGQTAAIGDYRSAGSGDWSTPATWQMRTGVDTWVVAISAPDATNTVHIQAGHTVTLTTGESYCKSLNIEKTGVLAAGAYTVNLSGKLRCYTLAAAVTSLTADSAYYGVSSNPVLTIITFTLGAPTIRFVGLTRTILVSGEWYSGTGAPLISFEFALNAGQTGTFNVGTRATNMTFVSGTCTTPTVTHIITGDLTIKSGAKLITQRNGTGAGSLGNVTGTPANKLEIEEGGTLEFKPASLSTPTIGFNTFVNNGTVIYNVAGAVSFMTTIVGTAITNTYNNITLIGGCTMTAIAPIYINGVLTLSSNVAANTLNTGGLVTLKSTAVKTATFAPLGTNAVINGDFIVERYIPAGQRAYRFLSSPVTTSTFIDTNWQQGTHITGAGGTTNGFDATTGNNPSMFTYNNVTPAWNALGNTNATVLTAGVPYLTYIRGSRSASLTTAQKGISVASDATTLSATGLLKTGNVLVSGLNEAADGFSAVGNPYQAQVDMQAVLIDAGATNLNTGFYYVVDPTLGTKGGYLAVDVTAAPTAHISQYLQPGQACFVKTLAAGPASLTFKEVHKSVAADQTSIFKTRNVATPSIDLTLYNGASNRLDVLKVAFDANETNDVNQNDASKMTNFDESMATANSGKLLSIEKRAMPIAADEIPLNITKYQGTSYSLKVQGSGLTEIPYLVDAFTGTTTEIPVDGTIDYAYTVDAGNAATTDASRFKLIYAKTLKTIDNSVAGFTLYPNPSKSNSFSVVVPQSMSKASLTVSNLLGQKLYSQNDLQSGTTVKVNPSNVKSAGVYLVSLTSEGKSTTTKWIVE